MDKIFWKQIGKNVEIYVDDMVVKFDSIYNISCARSIRNFLSNTMVQHAPKPSQVHFRGQWRYILRIRANQLRDQIQYWQVQGNNWDEKSYEVKRDMDVSGLAITSLSRYIPRQRNGPISRGIFLEIKHALTTPSILCKPSPRKTLHLYLSVSENAISVTLV